jgi:hypothetical protein
MFSVLLAPRQDILDARIPEAAHDSFGVYATRD